MTEAEKKFRSTVRTYWRKHGRHALPWRTVTDPYHIAVSEIMLQQTQVERVVPKYEVFIKRFPSVEKLAKAPLSEVLKLWQGLGYNRRAQQLHKCAKEVARVYDSEFPRSYEELIALPGIGPYTAGAILAFAYNTAHPIIETNIRTVYLQHFFNEETDVPEDKLMDLITATLDTKEPRIWFWALMDYGAYIKRTQGNPNQRARSHKRQDRFVGSDRQLRGDIIRALAQKPHSRRKLHTLLASFDVLRIDAQLERLTQEELIIKRGQRYMLSH